VPATQPPPVLYVVACGAPPAEQLPSFVGFALEQGWDVCVIATPDGTKFLDAARLEGLTGHPVRSEYKDPDEPDVLPPADAMVVAPATFNTINKWAQGISDTLALGLLGEAIGLGLPLAAAPWTNAPLAAHPVFQRSITVLAEWGVRVIVDLAQWPPADEGQTAFPWPDLRAELAELRRAAEERSAS
jgi:hypothetical protein